jgi:dTDP-glucose 4,6-dehydratase
MRTLLVTGGAGFIGSTFVAQQVKLGRYVVVLDALTYAGHRENLKWIKGGWELVEGNICDGALVSKLLSEHQPDAIVNFAAESHVDQSIAASAVFIETNIRGTHVLLEAARHYWSALNGDKKSTFRFVQISTDEVYGSLGEDGKFNEDSPIRPNSPYSASKAAGDHLGRAWFETYGLPTIVTHCTNNYGPRQYPEKLIPLMIFKALSGERLPVYGDGRNVRDWIHVEDHCSGVTLVLEKGRPGEAYDFGGDAEKRNLDVVHALCDILDAMRPRADKKSYREQIAFVKDRPGHDFRYAIDSSKAERELGFTRRYDFASGLRQTVEWYLDNQAWCEVVTRKAA